MGVISSQSLKDYKSQSSLLSLMRPIIVFEGHDGSGKTSCVESVIKSKCSYRFPGGSPESESLRRIIKKGKLVPKVEYLLQLACFSQTVSEYVHIKSMEEMYLIQTPVVFDRYWPSSLVYQHYISGIPSERILNDLRFFRVPFGDIFFFFYCTYDVAEDRINKRKSKDDGHWETFLSKSIQYYENVMHVINNTFSNVYTIDTSSLSKDEVNEFVKTKIKEHGYENILS